MVQHCATSFQRLTLKSQAIQVSCKPALPHIYLYVAGGLFSWLFYRQLAAAWWLPACGGMQRRGGWLWLAVVYLKQWSNLLQPHASNCWNHACQTRIEISAEYRVVIGKACFCSSTQWPPKSCENLMFVWLQKDAEQCGDTTKLNCPHCAGNLPEPRM